VEQDYLHNFKKFLADNYIQASFMGDDTVRFVTSLAFCDNQLDFMLKALKTLS